MAVSRNKQKEKVRFSEWYLENKESYNAKRREAYARSKQRRQKAIASSAKYKGSAPTVTRKVVRSVNGRNVQVYSTGQVAQMIGGTPQRIRTWDNAGIIPASVFTDDAHRLYTRKQVGLLRTLSKALVDTKGGWADPQVKRLVSRIKREW